MLRALKKLFRPKFLVQVNYKSGISMKFWVYEFSISNTAGLKFEWIACSVVNRPVLLNVDCVESVWQLRVKRWYYLW